MRPTPRLVVFLCVVGVLGVDAAVVRAQISRPRATVVALAERTTTGAGQTARLALKVSLPEGLHTQSNKPRDPLLIPTELTSTRPLA